MKSIVWESHKIKWDSSTGKLKNMCGSPHMEIGHDIHPEERKYGSALSAIFAIVTNNYKWNNSTNKTETSKGQTGKLVFET